jgi:predicted Zn-dependent peptidase
MDEALDKIEQVTAEELRDLAADLFIPAKMRLAIVGPTPRSEDKLAELIA